MVDKALLRPILTKEWPIWTLLVSLQIAALVNLILAPHQPIVPILICIVLLLAAAFFDHRVLLLLTTVSILASESVYIEAGPLIIRAIDFLVLYAALIVFLQWLTGSIQFERLLIFRFALGMLLFMAVVSLFGSISLSNSLFELIQIIELLIALILFYHLIRSERDLKLILLVLLIYSTADALWVLFQNSQGTLHGRHVGLFLGFANELSYGVATAVAFFYLAEKNWSRTLLIVSAGLQMAAIFLTKGRGLLVIAVVMTLLCIFFFGLYRRRFGSSILIAVCLTLVSLASLWFFSPEIQTRYASIVEGGQMRDLRLIMWAVALKVWQQYPIFGAGIGNIELVSARFLPKAVGIVLLAVGESLQTPHNEYLSFAVQGGTIGFVVGVLFYGTILWQGIQLYRKASRELSSGYAIIMLAFAGGMVIWNLANDMLLAGKGMFVMLIMAAMARLHSFQNNSREYKARPTAADLCS